MLWISTALEIAGPALIGYFIDHFLIKKTLSFGLAIKLAVGALILQIASTTLRYNQSLIFNRTALNIIYQMRTEVMNSALHQTLSMIDKQPVGYIISRVTNDTEVIKDLYVIVIASILRSFTLICSMLVAMFLLSWKLAVISLIIFPIVIIMMYLYQHYSTPVIRQLRSYIADINNIFSEAINGMDVIQQFCQQHRFGAKIHQLSYAHFKTRIATLQLEGYLLRPMISLLFALILYSMLFVFWITPRDEIGVGILYVFISYLGRLNEPLIELTSQQSILQQAIVAGERIFELIDAPAQDYGMDSRPLKSGSIILNHLNFSYAQGSQVLHQISLTVPDKSFTAIVGHTGSGKSTLANLIMGYYQVNKNTIFLDERPIETLSQQVLRKGIGMVQQDPIIMADTVYANVNPRRTLNENQVWHALKQVQLDCLVRSLSGGLYAELGEKGKILSVGQKQLIALARVLIDTPAILILDEATANIDSGTERSIELALQTIRPYTTLLVIAHRFSTIVKADQIIVLYKGKIIERGKHDELLHSGGHYYQMHQLQQASKIL